jgi:hypothetical protein
MWTKYKQRDKNIKKLVLPCFRRLITYVRNVHAERHTYGTYVAYERYSTLEIRQKTRKRGPSGAYGRDGIFVTVFRDD